MSEDGMIICSFREIGCLFAQIKQEMRQMTEQHRDLIYWKRQQEQGMKAPSRMQDLELQALRQAYSALEAKMVDLENARQEDGNAEVIKRFEDLKKELANEMKCMLDKSSKLEAYIRKAMGELVLDVEKFMKKKAEVEKDGKVATGEGKVVTTGEGKVVTTGEGEVVTTGEGAARQLKDVKKEPNDGQMTLTEAINGIKGSDPEMQFRCTESAGNMLSREPDPPIDDIIEAGVIPRLVEFLECADRPDLQFEASWALGNVICGTTEQTKVVVNAGAVVHFVHLLSSPRSNVADNAVWALGNIAGDDPELQEVVVKCGVVEPLLKLVKPDTPDDFLRNITWTISNLCEYENPHLSMATTRQILPVLARLINHTDDEVLSNICSALSNLTDEPNKKLQEVIDSGVCPRLVELLSCEETMEPSLQAVANIVRGTESQTQVILDCNALPAFHNLLRHTDISIQKTVAWTISNITRGSAAQIQAVIDSGLMRLIIQLLHKRDFKGQKEAAWAVRNLTLRGTAKQITHLAELSSLKQICMLLGVKDAELNHVLLSSIFNILNAADRIRQLKKVVVMIERGGGLNKIKSLKQHENERVKQAAKYIVKRYFKRN